MQAIRRGAQETRRAGSGPVKVTYILLNAHQARRDLRDANSSLWCAEDMTLQLYTTMPKFHYNWSSVILRSS